MTRVLHFFRNEVGYNPHVGRRPRGDGGARFGADPMDQTSPEQRLSHITTLWSLVRRAHGDADAAGEARRLLLERYSGAVHRYLLGALRDADAADELFQEFALRFVRGDFRNADPERGRFRDFVKSSLFYLVVKSRRRKQSAPRQLSPADEPSAEPDLFNSEEEFRRSWRDELLVRAWQALAQLQERTGQPFHTVLRCRTEHADLSSAALAEKLAGDLGKPLTAAAVRQLLHRAREKFAALLLDEVIHTLDNPTPQQIEDELLDVGVYEYCKQALPTGGT